jgi:GH43 family beta-xylosidase
MTQIHGLTRIFLVFLLLIMWGCAGNLSAPSPPKKLETFTNPILPAPSFDPWMVCDGGYYYYCESTGRHIYIRKTKRIPELAQAKPILIWSAPEKGANSDHVWAPELHRIGKKWYIYFAADDGPNENHRMWVLESTSDDPLKGFIEKGRLETERWAVDGTVLQMEDRRLYFVWSGWPGKTHEKQNIYIAPMKNPYTISGQRVLIATPDRLWEQNAHAICEAPEILKRDGMIFIVYSASASWTKDYCLGLLVNRDGNILNPSSWEKRGPVFEKNEEVWGVGQAAHVDSSQPLCSSTNP